MKRQALLAFSVTLLLVATSFPITGQGGRRPRIETTGLFNPHNSTFYFNPAYGRHSFRPAARIRPFESEWLPLAGDWNGDGKTTVGLYDPEKGVFRLKNFLGGTRPEIVFRVDAPSPDAMPLVGDWDGDGDETVGLYDPDTREVLLKNALAGSGFGFDITYTLPEVPGSALVAIAGDWDGDGRDTVGLYDRGESIFYLKNRQDDTAPDITFQFGPQGRFLLPVIGDWDGDGVDGIGVFTPGSNAFRLRNPLTPGHANLWAVYGQGGWLPLVGAW